MSWGFASTSACYRGVSAAPTAEATPVLPRLAYLTLCRSIQLFAQLARGDAAKDLEILVLRHQPSQDGTDALSRNAPGKPSNMEALLHGRTPRRGRTTRPCHDLSSLSGEVEAVARGDRSMQQCPLHQVGTPLADLHGPLACRR